MSNLSHKETLLAVRAQVRAARSHLEQAQALVNDAKREYVRDAVANGLEQAYCLIDGSSRAISNDLRTGFQVKDDGEDT